MNIEEIISKMTLKEKIALCTGADFWNTKKYEKYGIPSVKMSDGPHGVRCQVKESDMLGINDSHPATCFPTAVTAGATWNKELYRKEGKAIAKEAQALGVSVVLGPGCNIKRNPLGGRNFEYLSEDPYLSGSMAAEFIKGVQSMGVAACVKHFVANNQEDQRQSSDSILDERTLREIYLKPFEIAVKSGKPQTVMSSYNKVNGVYVSDNAWLLDRVLREEWGFDGAVITDWGGMNNRIAAFRAGCDLNMPGGSKYMHKAVYRAVKKGRLNEKYIDESVRRILTLTEKLQNIPKAPFDPEEHHALAKRIAVEGAVLLKNEGGILPLTDTDAVLIGSMAKDIRYQGIGSSHINPTKLSSLTDAMPEIEYLPCGNSEGDVTDCEIDAAVKAAEKKRVAILAVGLPENYESEAFDREHMSLPDGYNKLVEAVAKVNKNTVVLLFGGGVMELPWADKVAAILYMGLGGQAVGEAAAELISGKANPSGKLSESWAQIYGDVVSSDTFGQKNAEYREGIYVGYRYYDKSGISPRYPFGHGLSYTSFEYSSLSVSDRKVTFYVKNIGDRKGAEVAQVYVAAPWNDSYREEKKLCGFEKIELDAGESREISIALDDGSFAFWKGGWHIQSGEYSILVGASSKDIRLEGKIMIEGEDTEPEKPSAAWYSSPKGKPTKEDWEALLGHKVEYPKKQKKRDFTLASTISEMRQSSLFMKIVAAVVELVLRVKFKSKSSTTYKMMLASVEECPVRAMEICSGGAMNDTLAKLIILIAKII